MARNICPCISRYAPTVTSSISRPSPPTAKYPRSRYAYGTRMAAAMAPATAAARSSPMNNRQISAHSRVRLRLCFLSMPFSLPPYWACPPSAGLTVSACASCKIDRL